MKITKRQSDVINDIIREEISSILRGRDKSHAVDRILMSEATDLTSTLEAACTDLEGEMYNSASQLRQIVDKILYAKLAGVIRNVTGNAISAVNLMDMVEDFDADALQEAGMALDSDVSLALETYCNAVTSLVAATQSGFEE